MQGRLHTFCFLALTADSTVATAFWASCTSLGGASSATPALRPMISTSSWVSIESRSTISVATSDLVIPRAIDWLSLHGTERNVCAEFVRSVSAEEHFLLKAAKSIALVVQRLAPHLQPLLQAPIAAGSSV